MRKFLASLAMLGLASVPAAAQSIGGTYTVAGTNFDGSKYGGEATITLTSDTTCTIHWEPAARPPTASACATTMPFQPAM